MNDTTTDRLLALAEVYAVRRHDPYVTTATIIKEWQRHPHLFREALATATQAAPRLSALPAPLHAAFAEGGIGGALIATVAAAPKGSLAWATNNPATGKLFAHNAKGQPTEYDVRGLSSAQDLLEFLRRLDEAGVDLGELVKAA